MILYRKEKHFIIFVTVFVVVLTALPLMTSAQEPLVPTDPLVPCSGATGADECGYDDLIEGFGSILTFGIYFAGAVAIVLFAWAGFLMLFSRGNKGQIDKGKSILWNTVIGFLIVLTAWLIIATILGFFGVQGGPIEGINPS